MYLQEVPFGRLMNRVKTTLKENPLFYRNLPSNSNKEWYDRSHLSVTVVGNNPHKRKCGYVFW